MAEVDPLIYEFYPDLISAGGLVALLQETGRVRGRGVGEVVARLPGASIGTARGTISIKLSKERRNFLIDISVPGFNWASGSTDDLGSLVEAISAWLEGASLREFEANFSFMCIGEFAQGLEAGNVTELKWAEMLSSDYYLKQRDALSHIHADSELRELLPTVSHGVVRLSVNPLSPQVGDNFLIDVLPGRGYEVRVAGKRNEVRLCASLDDLIVHLKELRLTGR